jgi:glycosyltransferase involved in cell wall biosynthesis
MAKKNVLLFFGEKRSSGGIETYVNLLNQSLSQDYNLHKIFFTKDKELVKNPPHNTYPILINKGETINGKKTVNDFYDKVFDLDDKFQFDLFHINASNIIAGYILANEAKDWAIPVISTNHYWKETKHETLIEREKNSRKTFLLSEKVICVSQACADEMDYLSEDKKVVIHPGIDIDFFKPTHIKDENQFNLIYPAAYTQFKNQMELIKFVSEFKKKSPNFKIHLYGSANTPASKGYLNNLELNILNTDQENYFSLNQDVSLDQMPDLLSRSDLLISTSLYESFGQIFTEAQACETPVIGYNLGGIPETMQDKRTGFLVQPGNIDELVKYAKKFYDSPSLIAEFGKRGREFIKDNFCSKKQAEKYTAEYKKILG